MGNVSKIKEAASYGSLDYKKLNLSAMNNLTDLSDTIAKMQQDLEELYLDQTESNDIPENRPCCRIHISDD